ncbi:hypothetical protein [Amycolatopsis nigrescens]|uniref:hypothetical protein n=1 Tax=Amycolatopsis nigrescens TaxID=381445 RepID=UPI0003A37E92|nr:hypothetical protein [Amycolatopsis nigrescens]
MNVARKAFISLSVAGITAAGVLAGGGIASAESGAYLELDRTTVAQGETVNVLARCDTGEALNLVGSEAFAPTGQDGPYEGNGGVAVFTREVAGNLEGQAGIRTDVAPGTYRVTERCGGGNAGGVDITVLPAS